MSLPGPLGQEGGIVQGLHSHTDVILSIATQMSF